MNTANSIPEYVSNIIKYLDCPARYFPPCRDDDEIVSAYTAAAEEGKTRGYIPVLVVCDKLLLENLIINSASGDSREHFSPSLVKRYRESFLSCPPDTEYIDGLREKAEELRNTLPDAVAAEDSVERFYGYWDFDSGETLPLILAKIPAENPGQIFAYLPFSPSAGCPQPKQLEAAADCLYRRYTAVAAVIGANFAEFDLKTAPAGKDRVLAAVLHSLICPQILADDEGNLPSDIEKTEILADYSRSVAADSKWYFCW